MASDVDTAPLVGRSATMAPLRSALYDDLRPGQTGAVFLTGESGVGKTRLLTEAGEQLRRGGALVLTGTCLDIGDASPLHPVRQALRRLDAEQADARTVLSRCTPATGSSPPSATSGSPEPNAA